MSKVQYNKLRPFKTAHSEAETYSSSSWLVIFATFRMSTPPPVVSGPFKKKINSCSLSTNSGAETKKVPQTMIQEIKLVLVPLVGDTSEGLDAE